MFPLFPFLVDRGIVGWEQEQEGSEVNENWSVILDRRYLMAYGLFWVFLARLFRLCVRRKVW